MRFFAAFVMQGRLKAVISVAGLAALSLWLPLVSLFSSAALALVALRKGLSESAWVLGVSLLVLAALGTVLTGSVGFPLVYGLLMWLPVWLVALLLRFSSRLALVLEVALGMGVMGVLAVYLLVQDPMAMWREKLHRFIQPMLENAPPEVDRAMLEQNLEFYSHYMTGVVATGSVVGLILGLLLARWWQSVLYYPGGFRSEFLAVRIDAPAAYLGLASLALALFAEGLPAEIAWNVNLLFLVLFLVAGFAILHTLLSGKKFWLVGFYIALFFIPFALLPVAVLGFSDVWMNWRRRVSSP